MIKPTKHTKDPVRMVSPCKGASFLVIDDGEPFDARTSVKKAREERALKVLDFGRFRRVKR
jgi:hypothetical protein